MNELLPYLFLVLIVGAVWIPLVRYKHETFIFYVAIITVSVHLCALLIVSLAWIVTENMPLFFKGPILYATESSEFSITLFFDGITSVYALVAGMITFVISVFSRYYMHRDKGFKRFFSNLLFFYTGLQLVLFSGNFETLFIGWEILGVTSFFLIAYYRDRYLPVKNALKVISLYRVADIALLLGIWICHHYFHESINFLTLFDLQAHHQEIIQGRIFQLIIPGIFLVAAMVKSALLPFSTWLPRAMEGPTTSSAIFYGSLSVHIGVFLMLRTYPFWEGNFIFETVVIALGLGTSFIAAGIAKVQSTVKTQIAYSSITQIGIIFVEVALGFHVLALIHFACNAFLRTYQLLVSPSVLSYRIHDQFFNFTPPVHGISDSFWGRVKATLYVLSLREWGLDTFMYRFLWRPMKKAGQLLGFVDFRSIILVFIPLYLVGDFIVYSHVEVPQQILEHLPGSIALVGLLFSLRALFERINAQTAWVMLVINQFYLLLSVSLNEQFDNSQALMFLSGVIVSAGTGHYALARLKKKGELISLDRFHGYALEHPTTRFIFLLACLGLAGFPITPTFIGEDLIIGHIHANQFVLTSLIALNLIIDGLAIFRIYARLFLGTHPKTSTSILLKSS